MHRPDGIPKRTAPATWVVVLSWIAVAAVAIAIFAASAQTGDDLDDGTGILSVVKDWLASVAAQLAGHEVDVSPIGHFTEYLLFGVALCNALRWHMPLQRAWVYALVIASCYGVTDEFHQLFVPDRACDPADWLVDTVAAGIGAFATRSWLLKRR
ncbi:VanZ family protein [Slackia heliotrinireducens]|uniref:VanZ family protein n=1 Tax=Slackia heliotrinireducens TaxID=84110 RepID=UPI003314FAFD